jgi:DNA-binding NarL/FixJ family response regulator
MTTTDKINIAIIDDDSLVVQLLKGFLEKSVDPTFNIVLTANSGNSFLEKLTTISTDNLDIILLDMRMADGDGLSVLEQLQKLGTTAKVIVLSSFWKKAYIGQMINLGAHAFLPKEIDKEDLIAIIEETYRKGHYFTPEQLDTLRPQIAAKSPKLHIQPKDTLTTRELDILQLIVQQHTTKEIATKLFITSKTVEAHKSNLFSKTGVKNTVGLVMYAIQNGLIDPDSFIIRG